MDLQRLIAALSQPEAYPHPADPVEVRQTHVSAVFLAGAFVYKVKKPVALGFLDFGTLPLRRHFCQEEVRLNRRLAPSVYRGVVPVTRSGDGVRVGGTGEVVEWAVQMERLPDAAQLGEYVLRGEADADRMGRLARRLAAFHAAADAGPEVAALGRFDIVAGNARDNFTQSAAHVGVTVSRAVLERLQELTEQALDRLRPLIEARADRGVPRDGHGDLRLDHVYLFPERQPPDDVLAIDCIEFNERFRCGDPVADVAFLVADLLFVGRADLAGAFSDTYLAAGDAEGHALLPFYTSYRAAVRGKVDGLKSEQPEVSAADRETARQHGRARWLLALGQLEEPSRRPGLMLVGGLPGTGKSTLARGLAERDGFTVVRSDAVRKELAGGGGPGAFEAGIYSPEWTGRTYAECLRRAEGLLFEGKRVVVDASFREDARRQEFLDLGRRLCVPAVCLLGRATPATVRARLAGRHGDVSDADWSVHEQAAARWQEPGSATAPFVVSLDADGDPEAVREQAEAALRTRGLLAPG
jgi:aminoglycoside phosphotransferase family enzyme/predicted kinase